MNEKLKAIALVMYINGFSEGYIYDVLHWLAPHLRNEEIQTLLEFAKLRYDNLSTLLTQQLSNKDIEEAHIYADEVLVRLLKYLGFNDIVKTYNKVDKWYA